MCAFNYTTDTGNVRTFWTVFNVQNAGEPGVEKIVTELWHSLLLSQHTYKYLLVCLRELIDCVHAQDLTNKTAGLLRITDAHLQELKKVWIKWHNLRVRIIFSLILIIHKEMIEMTGRTVIRSIVSFKGLINGQTGYC